MLHVQRLQNSLNYVNPGSNSSSQCIRYKQSDFASNSFVLKTSGSENLVGFWLQEHGLHACRVSFGDSNCCSIDCCFHCHMQILISSRILGAGTWLHAGYHLTTAIAAPSLLSLPYAFSFLGWAPGLLAITICGLVSSYAYCLLSQVLDDCASKGHRFYRFRELSQFVIGQKWTRFFVIPVQFGVCFVTVIGAILAGGSAVKVWIVYIKILASILLKFSDNFRT
jgi:hypothetical protein